MKNFKKTISETSSEAEKRLNADDVLKEIRGLSRKKIVQLIITERKARKRAEREAGIDGLTGLMTQAAFLKEAEKSFQHALREGEPFAVAFMDMDKFKFINDNYGHLVGDEVLKTMGEKLREVVRIFDKVGRYGGEEFIIFFEGCHTESLSDLKKRLVAFLRDAVVKKIPRVDPQHIGVSVGIVGWRGEKTLAEVIDKADKAMYADKQLGRIMEK